MKQEHGITNFVVIYTFLLSGLSFFSVNTAKGTPFLFALTFAVTFLLICALILLTANIHQKTAKQTVPTEFSQKTRVIMLMAGLCSCAVIYCFYTSRFVNFLPSVSDNFEGGRFSVLFPVISLILAVYIGKGGFVSFSRMCILFLPALILPYILTFFNFLSYGKKSFDAVYLPPSLTFDLSYLPDVILVCAGVSFLFFTDPDKKSGLLSKKVLLFSFVAFFATFLLEFAKYILFFGTDGFCAVVRPDLTMLAQMPFMNIQEIFIFTYCISYVLKISVFSAAFSVFVKKLDKKDRSQTVYSAISAILLSVFYFFFKSIVGKTEAIISFAVIFCIFFAFCIGKCSFRPESSKIENKKHSSAASKDNIRKASDI